MIPTFGIEDDISSEEEIIQITNNLEEKNDQEKKTESLFSKIYNYPYYLINKGGEALVKGLGTQVAEKELDPIFKTFKKEFKNITNKKIPEFKQKLLEALLKQPPHEFTELKKFLDQLIKNPENITQKDIEEANKNAKIITENKHEFLKLFESIIEKERLEDYKELFFSLFSLTQKKPKKLKQKISSEEAKNQLKEFGELFNEFLTPFHEGQGALTQALSHLQTSLISENGILTQAVKVLEQKCLNENDGLMKQVVSQLTQLLTQKEGPLDLIGKKLTEGEESLIAKAIDLIKSKLLSEGGVVEELGKRFNDKESGIISQALSTAQKHINEMLEQSLYTLKKELNSDNGLLATLRNKMIGEEGSILNDAIKFLNENLFDQDKGMVSKLRQELTHKEHGMLAQAIQILAKEINDEQQGILAQGIKILKEKLTGEKGVLDEALQLLENRLQGKDGVFDKLQNNLLNEENGLLTKALNVLKDKLTNEEQGILATLSKRLNDPKDGILATAVNTLNQKLIGENGTLALLEQKLLGNEDGLVSKAIVMLQNKLQENVKLLEDQLTKKEGTIDRVLNLLQNRLMDEDGVLNKALHLLDERLTDEETGVLHKAMKILTTQLIGQDGLIDKLSGKLTETAHPLLSKSRDLLVQLQTATMNHNTTAIKNLCGELKPILEQLISLKDTVFAKQPLANNDLLILSGLKGRLADLPNNIPLNQTEMMLIIEAGLSTIDRYYNQLAGIADKFGDVLNTKLNAPIERFEKLLKTNVDHLLGNTSSNSPSQPSSLPNNPTGSAGGISNFLNYGASLLGTIGTWVSKEALGSFAGIFASGIRQVRAKLPENDLESGKVLDSLLIDLNNLKENGNWSALFESFKQASEALSHLNINIHGFNLPKSSPVERKSAEPIFGKNIDLLKKVSDGNPVKSPEDNKDWKAKAEKETDSLIDNTANFLIIKRCYETICQLKPSNDNFYLKLLKEAKENGIIQTDKLKKLLFEKLDAEQISWHRKIWARISYRFTGYFYRTYIKKAVEVYREEIFKFIDKQKEDGFKSFQNGVIKNFTRYLSILGGAYKKIANNTTYPGTLSEMVKIEFENKELNLGFKPQELYQEFAQTVLKKATGSGLIAGIARLVIKNPEKIVGDLIDSATSSLQNKEGYTHALNCVLREQLDEILKLLQENLAQRNRHSSAGLKEEENKVEGQKPLIAELVKNLFPVLRKSKCTHVDELEKLLKGELVSANVNQAIDSLFIQEVLQEVTSLLTVATQSLVKEEQLQKLTYTFAHLANQTFEIGKQVGVDEMEKEQRAIATRSEEILQLAVNTAVQDKFDHSGKKQQDKANGFIESLHERSQKYFDGEKDEEGKEKIKGAVKILEELSKMDLSSFDAFEKIKALVDGAHKYEDFGNTLSLRAKESNLHSNSKNEISNRYFHLAEQSQPYIEAIAEIKQHSRALENLSEAIPDVKEILKIAPSIHAKLFTNSLTTENIIWAEGQVKRLQEILHILGKKLGSHEVLKKIVKEEKALGQILISLQNALKLQSLSSHIAPNSTIDQIAMQKKKSLGVLNLHFAPNKGIATLKQQLRLSLSTEANIFLPELLKKLDAIENATLEEQINVARNEFIELMGKVIEKGTSQIEESRKQSELCYKAIANAIDTSELLQSNFKTQTEIKIKEAIVKAQQELNNLRKWEEENIKKISYINFSLGQMQWVEDLASGVVYNRVRDHLDGFFEFLRKEETYNVGVFRHGFLIPYIQKMRKE